MEQLSEFTGLYPLSKTLRFGLTLKEYEKKNKSHIELKSLIDISQKRVMDEATKDIDKTENDLVRMVSTCVELMNRFMHSWGSIYRRTDQIVLTKDFYKRIAVKARFDAFWEKNDIKQPQTQLISISSLNSKHSGITRKDYILGYWSTNINISKQKLHEFELILNQYKLALDNENLAHTKPRLVDFRKMFLTIIRLCNETLIPLNNGSISFPGLDKLQDNEKNDKLRTFVSKESKDQWKELSLLIQSIKDYFEENGGYVTFGKVTLNKYTAQQKPHIFKKDIDRILNDKLKIIDLTNKLINQSEEEIGLYFHFIGQNKKQLIKSEDISIIERVQLFKHKPIPVSVRFMLAEYLSKNHDCDKEKTLALFEQIGASSSIGEIYANIPDKNDFNLKQFPLKPAFDYAWENVARYMNNERANAFPLEQCLNFLQELFNVNKHNKSLKLYADLLFIKENLATLEHEDNSPKDKDKFIENIKKTFLGIDYLQKQKENKNHEEAIIRWIDLEEGKQKEYKNNNHDTYKIYDKSKKEFGLLRGRQKNNIQEYKELTEDFKKLAVCFGKYIADLREKLREVNEINKITHFGIIVEDNTKDKYFLLSKLDENRTSAIDGLLINEPNGELKSYQIKSLTSKSLEKITTNPGGYKEFHDSDLHINYHFVKTNWSSYKNENELINYTKDCLVNSEMAKTQKWNEFGCDFSKCNSFEAIERELETKAYILKQGQMSKTTIVKLVEEENCLLLPIVNQDITSETHTLKNQFSKDWKMIYDNDNGYRLHPEFRIVYRQPTPDYPKNKRYSRFQLIAHLLCEYIPQTGNYITRKELNEVLNDKTKQENNVTEFNKKLKLDDNFYVFGIDRGLSQLATICVLNNKGQIQGDFEIYSRFFDTENKEWKHSLLEKRAILDLSNLRVETTIEGEKVLVDLSKIKVKDEKGNYTKENLQKIKLKQLSYIRKLQFQMQHESDKVLRFLDQNTNPNDVEKNIGELISPYKEGKHFDDLPIDYICDILLQFKQLNNDNNERAIKELIELDSAEDLKYGVVANMVGVVGYLIEKFNYNAFISLENLCRAYGFAKDGLTGDELKSTSIDKTVDFKDQENLVLAGLGTYHFFEMQLLKKMLRIQKGNEILHLVPAFRSVDNYETIRKLSKKEKTSEYTCKPFGIVHFVDPSFTSKKCPVCEGIKVKRNKTKGDIVVCDTCGFISNWEENNGQNNHIIEQNKKQNLNLNFIKNGDDNGAYHIALKTLKNLNTIL